MEDIEAHFQEDHFKKFAEEVQQYLAGPNALSIGKYHPVSCLSIRFLYISNIGSTGCRKLRECS